MVFGTGPIATENQFPCRTLVACQQYNTTRDNVRYMDRLQPRIPTNPRFEMTIPETFQSGASTRVTVFKQPLVHFRRSVVHSGTSSICWDQATGVRHTSNRLVGTMGWAWWRTLRLFRGGWGVCRPRLSRSSLQETLFGVGGFGWVFETPPFASRGSIIAGHVAIPKMGTGTKCRIPRHKVDRTTRPRDVARHTAAAPVQ